MKTGAPTSLTEAPKLYGILIYLYLYKYFLMFWLWPRTNTADQGPVTEPIRNHLINGIMVSPSIACNVTIINLQSTIRHTYQKQRYCNQFLPSFHKFLLARNAIKHTFYTGRACNPQLIILQNVNLSMLFPCPGICTFNFHNYIKSSEDFYPGLDYNYSFRFIFSLYLFCVIQRRSTDVPSFPHW